MQVNGHRKCTNPDLFDAIAAERYQAGMWYCGKCGKVNDEENDRCISYRCPSHKLLSTTNELSLRERDLIYVYTGNDLNAAMSEKPDTLAAWAAGYRERDGLADYRRDQAARRAEQAAAEDTDDGYRSQGSSSGGAHHTAPAVGRWRPSKGRTPSR